MRGSCFARLAFLGLALSFLLCSSSAHAQVVQGNNWPTPRLSLITPSGGKVGTNLEVGFTGADLTDPEMLWFSHPGIKATPIIPPDPKPDPKAKPDPKKDMKPPVTKFNVVIDKSVPPGAYDVRFVNKLGVSNPRVFIVGELSEVIEKEPNNDVEQATRIEPGTTINGAIQAAADVDYYVFSGKKGQRISVTVLGNSIDSRLSPEMKIIGPISFPPEPPPAKDPKTGKELPKEPVKVSLESGRDLAYNRASPQQDGYLDLTLPADGEYLIRLNQFTYIGGSPEFFYRLNLGTAPWIDAVYPPVVEAGKPAQVTLLGRNLPGGKAEPSFKIGSTVLETLTATITPPADVTKLTFAGSVAPPSASVDGFEYRLPSAGGLSNPVLLAFAQGPIVLEKEGNDTADKAQAIPSVVELCGKIDRVRDRDWYVFDAKKGDTLVMEMFSERLGAPTDMFFVVRNLETKAEFPMADDTTDIVNTKNFYNFTKDPGPFRFVAATDGKYHILVGSQVGDILAGPEHIYRLRITQEKPDFRLVVMPGDDFRQDAVTALKGGNAYFEVMALRRDGFKDDIVVSMEGLPTGVTCPPQVLSGKVKSVYLVVNAADSAPNFTGEVKVAGTAIINGAKVTREARPATPTWPVQPQQNIPTITRLDRSLVMAVRDKAPGKLASTLTTARVTVGDKLNIPLKLTRTLPEFKGNFQVAPVPGDLPPNINFGALTFAPGKDDQTAILTVAPTVLPGTYNVVFRGFAPIPPGGEKSKPANTVLVSTPVQVVVLPKTVANLTVDNANPTIKLGKEQATGVVTVNVARQFDYADSFKVELILPKEAKDISADPIVIPAKENSAKLTLKVPPTAAPGNRANLTVRATAVIHGDVVLVHETKINVNVVK